MNRMRTIALAACFVVSAASGASSQGRARTDAQFVGAWRLVSWEQRATNGTVTLNSRSSGSILYSDSGRMCAMLMDPKRSSWSGRRPSDAEVREAYDGVVAYCGRYEVNLAEGFVVHDVDLEKSPTSVGIKRKRWFRFDGPNKLTLRVDAAENPPGLAESTLTWERVVK